MSKRTALSAALAASRVEKDVENAYRAEVSAQRADASWSSPHATDGLAVQIDYDVTNEGPGEAYLAHGPLMTDSANPANIALVKRIPMGETVRASRVGIPAKETVPAPTDETLFYYSANSANAAGIVARQIFIS